MQVRHSFTFNLATHILDWILDVTYDLIQLIFPMTCPQLLWPFFPHIFYIFSNGIYVYNAYFFFGQKDSMAKFIFWRSLHRPLTFLKKSQKLWGISPCDPRDEQNKNFVHLSSLVFCISHPSVTIWEIAFFHLESLLASPPGKKRRPVLAPN